MIDITWIVVCCFLGLSLLYLTYEQITIKKVRNKIKILIHVNGTRGKSTVCRMIDAIMREAGYKTFTKTTGTLPMIIHPDGEVTQIKRLGRANIREQITMIREAVKEEAEIVILECMAVDPHLQWLSERMILHADINVITNARHDHICEMGSTIEAIVAALANTIPEGKIMVTADAPNFALWEMEAQKRNAKCVLIEADFTPNQFTFLEQNASLAEKTASILGINHEIASAGLKKYLPDPGAFQFIEIGPLTFVNAMSANDPDSTRVLYQDVARRFSHTNITLLVNNRADRPERTKQNIALIQELHPVKVWITGDNTHYVYRAIKGITDARFYHHFDDLSDETVVFAFGNIAITGFKILNEALARRNTYGH